MCAIVDANVASEVFGPERPEAGRRFFDWLTSQRGQLVVAGDLLRELSVNNAFLTWFRTAINSARVRQVGSDALATHLDELASKTCKSNDKHVLALAAASGARLLYTNDRALIDDFHDRAILSNPGKVYTTGMSKSVTSTHKRLLARRDLCRSQAGSSSRNPHSG